MTPSHKLTYCLSYFLLLCLTASSLFKLLPLKMINCWSPPFGNQGGQVNQSCCHKREVGTQRGVVVEEAPHTVLLGFQKRLLGIRWWSSGYDFGRTH